MVWNIFNNRYKVSEGQFNYDLWSGFSLAIQVAWIIQSFSLLREYRFDYDPHKITFDFSIWVVLLLVWIVEEMIVRRTFIDQSLR